MSLTPEQKSCKDRARFHKNGGAALLPKALALLFPTPVQGGARGQKAARAKLATLSKKSHLADTVLRQLVGQGFLRPESDVYKLTAKGFKLCTTPSPASAK